MRDIRIFLKIYISSKYFHKLYSFAELSQINIVLRRHKFPMRDLYFEIIFLEYFFIISIYMGGGLGPAHFRSQIVPGSWKILRILYDIMKSIPDPP